MTNAFAESSKCRAEILNFLKTSKLHFSFRSLCSWSNRLLMRASTIPYKGKCWDVLRFWVVASWNRPRRDFHVACMYRKWGVSKTFGKHQLPSKLQLCRFSKANWIFPLTFVSMTVFYKGKICLTSKETTSLYARLCTIWVPFFF